MKTTAVSRSWYRAKIRRWLLECTRAIHQEMHARGSVPGWFKLTYKGIR
jgi:hypothetical protein